MENKPLALLIDFRHRKMVPLRPGKMVRGIFKGATGVELSISVFGSRPVVVTVPLPVKSQPRRILTGEMKALQCPNCGGSTEVPIEKYPIYEQIKDKPELRGVKTFLSSNCAFHERAKP